MVVPRYYIPTMIERDPPTGVRLPPPIKGALDRLVKTEGRSRSSLIVEAVAEMLRKRGYLKAKT